MTETTKKRVVLGITGGIAAYKAAELTRLCVQANIDVQVVMTDAAQQFITAVTMQALSGNKVHTNLWDADVANNMAHIDLSRDADAILIAPASADFIAKLVQGRADDLLSTLCLARDCPLLVAPAMNKQMWEAPATQRNIKQLALDGISVLGPAAGDQACGEVGMGRMLEAAELFAELQKFLLTQKKTLKNNSTLLAGKNILITAGPTFEAIDAVRGITNSSSGKMGYAVAQAALEAGANVTLISGPVAIAPPTQAKMIHVTCAAQMAEAVKKNIADADMFISVAAVADYTPVKTSAQKIKKTSASLQIELKPTEDILAYVASLPDAPFCVGFAAESNDLHEYAEAKRQRKKIPLLAANLVQEAMGRDDNALILFDDEGAHPLPRGPKIEQARLLISHAAKLFSAHTSSKKPALTLASSRKK
ncbi:MAG: phosphopantothenate synthase [Pseudomonadota bacterium]|jgi:phosphopantothenoylcysteine decarboxylase / phosphopantothenate---cysteine ligase